ncbi:hypothetical protein [Pseudonocardia sp. TRM90224]|uniref:hypothetical protein n=1 Tax=Pseudonocardia sp. TRM90224 TaxID=2812678 RepID=UPI001E33BD8F|nr:hypothetical protein [Pseudonocardia sp. TRM90224]
MPDRFADAVRARRAELRAERALLAGSHRAELRNELALSKVEASATAEAAFGRLTREVRQHLDAAGRRHLRALPTLVAEALAAMGVATGGAWAAALRPALRRIAARRSLALPPGWPHLPEHRIGVAPPEPEPARPTLALLVGAAGGVTASRAVVLPLVLLPLAGLPAIGGAGLLPLGAGAAVAGAVVALRSHGTSLRRAALRRAVDDALVAARTALDNDLARRLLEVERTVGVELDAAAAARLAVLDRELREILPGGEP